MNKTLRLIALCLGSAAVGGFIALRLGGHPQLLPDAPTPSAAIGATSVTALAPVSPAAVRQSDRIAQPMVAVPPVSTPKEARDDYDFDSLAGPSRNLAHRFDSEGRDPGWASRAIDTVSHELEGQPVFSKLSSVDVDCKVTLCRIEATLPLEALQAMGPNANFSWGGIVSNLVQSPPWNADFDNISDEESMDNSLGQAHFITYLHRRPQSAAAGSRTAS
jgi:hypothetical protein